ncbi:MAG TPA: potassium-transporting ATPase subunit KdpA, partial [Phycisphaerae bacterium]|nr:potassium-transporting ATPase subunit KdpA [Phycisphaerae bacterium]
MTEHGWIQIAIYTAVVLLLAEPLGRYMARVYEFKPLFGLDKILGPIERLIYKICGVKVDDEQDWKQYAIACIAFSLLSVLVVYLFQRLQWYLPLNPAHQLGNTPDSSFNTAASFPTNTNWQDYGGETTMSYLTQMMALAVQNFLSPAVGLAVMVALFRGLARKTTQQIGSFWVDLTRSVLYVMLPLAVIWAVLLLSQGVPQTFSNYKTVNLVQPSVYQVQKTDAKGNVVNDSHGNPVMINVTATQQTIAVGPVASQIAIKQLGTNGGGFF